jgi:surface carbohydrate biosynthesis protein
LEIKVRELEGRSLLAFEAASRGFTVIIGNKNHIKHLLRSNKLPAGLYFDKSVTRGKEKQIQEMVEKGCCIVSQDEESGILNLTYDKFLSVRSTPDTIGMASAVFCWGDSDYNAWKRLYPYAEEKLYRTGSPRIDFWRPDFQEYYRKKIEKINAKYGKYILLSSNFTQANSYMSVNERIDRAKKIGVIKNKIDENHKLNDIQNRINLFNHFVDLINKLSFKYKNVNFIVRPHPSEDMSGWKKKLANVKNIHVVFEGSISPWVRASQLVLHNACTTGIEAYVAGIPAVAYLPIVSDRNEKLSNQLSLICSSDIEVENYIDQILSNKLRCPHFNDINDKIIANRLFNIDGDTAAKRIVDVLENLNSPISFAIKTGYSEWIDDKIISARRIFNKLRRFDNKSTRKFPNLKYSELKQIQKNLSKVKTKYRKCEIRHLFGDVFLIERR